MRLTTVLQASCSQTSASRLPNKLKLVCSPCIDSKMMASTTSSSVYILKARMVQHSSRTAVFPWSKHSDQSMGINPGLSLRRSSATISSGAQLKPRRQVSPKLESQRGSYGLMQASSFMALSAFTPSLLAVSLETMTSKAQSKIGCWLSSSIWTRTSAYLGLHRLEDPYPIGLRTRLLLQLT